MFSYRNAGGMEMRWLRIVAVGLFAILFNTPVSAEPLYNKPVYNPESKSYFELYSPDAADPKKGPSLRADRLNGFMQQRWRRKKSPWSPRQTCHRQHTPNS